VRVSSGLAMYQAASEEGAGSLPGVVDDDPVFTPVPTMGQPVPSLPLASPSASIEETSSSHSVPLRPLMALPVLGQPNSPPIVRMRTPLLGIVGASRGGHDLSPPVALGAAVTDSSHEGTPGGVPRLSRPTVLPSLGRRPLPPNGAHQWSWGASIIAPF